MRTFWVLATFFLVAVLSLPQIFSGDWSKKKMEKRLEKHFGGSVEIEDLSLSWFKKQRCLNVKWRHEENGINFVADEVCILESLSNCVRFEKKPLKIVVKGANVIHSSSRLVFLKKKTRELELDFARLCAEVVKGVIHFEPVDVQVNQNMHIKTAGTVDLGKKEVDVLLKTSPETLRNMIKEANYVPDDISLEIPLKTSLQDKAIEKALTSFLMAHYPKKPESSAEEEQVSQTQDL